MTGWVFVFVLREVKFEVLVCWSSDGSGMFLFLDSSFVFSGIREYSAGVTVEVLTVFSFLASSFDPKFAVLASAGDVVVRVVLFFVVSCILFGCILCLV